VGSANAAQDVSPPRMTTGEIAALVNGELLGPVDLHIERLDAIDLAGPHSLTFIRSAAFGAQWAKSAGTAALVTKGVLVPGHDPSIRALIVVPDADRAMIPLLEAFAPRHSKTRAGIHPSAIIDSSAKVDPSASVGPLCVIGPGATVGAGAALVSSVTLGTSAIVGAESTIHAGVVIGDRCVVGRHCILHPNVTIGADGFGYRPEGQALVKVPHIGNVVLGDHVEIGASSCVDRAKFGSTTIGTGTKIDNLVQIGHNCRIGRSCIICGQCGLSGSVTLGDGVILGGSVGIADNLTIGSHARLAARAGVIEDVPAGETWLGQPAQPARLASRNVAVLRDIANHIRELRKLQRADAAHGQSGE
jgi:UDP-3-O-[3-hydroxymyristoyl] glucosamine N-acyltransferase